jgi:hypothetical protein
LLTEKRPSPSLPAPLATRLSRTCPHPDAARTNHSGASAAEARRSLGAVAAVAAAARERAASEAVLCALRRERVEELGDRVG